MQMTSPRSKDLYRFVRARLFNKLLAAIFCEAGFKALS